MNAIEPELWVEHPEEAVLFYRTAFQARVLFSSPDGALAQLAVGDARFWVGGVSPELGRFSPLALGGGTSRTLLVVDDPDQVVRSAVGAGATEKSPVQDEHVWRLGRIVDPSGHEWEIGRPVGPWPPA